MRWSGGVFVWLLGAGMLLLFFWPRGEDVRLLMLDLWFLARSWGLPQQVSPESFATVANGIAFVPMTFALTLFVRRIPPWIWALSGFAFGGGIELMQLLAMESRMPELLDIGANGVGGMLGATAGSVVLRIRRIRGSVHAERRRTRSPTAAESAEPVHKHSCGSEGRTGRSDTMR